MAAKKPVTMQFYAHGTTVGKLREKIRAYARHHGMSLPDAARAYLEELAVDSGRASYARGVQNVEVYVHRTWPKK
jgi:hypothetical protein